MAMACGCLQGPGSEQRSLLRRQRLICTEEASPGRLLAQVVGGEALIQRGRRSPLIRLSPGRGRLRDAGSGPRLAAVAGSSGGRAGGAAGAASSLGCAAHSPGAPAPQLRRAGWGPPPAPLTLRDDAQRALPVNHGEIRDGSLSERPPPALSPSRPRPPPRPLPIRKLRIEGGGVPQIKR